MALTPKKRAFIDAVRGGASNRDAAVAAGCPEKSASAAGSRLAKDRDVVLELQKLNALYPNAGGVKAVKGPGDVEQPGLPEDEAAPETFDLARGIGHRDPKDYLLAVMNDLGSEAKLRVDAAKALMPFMHQRKGEGGKKDQAKEKAAGAAQGKFGVRAPPQLRSIPGGK
jgi:phage terminase small subunit